MIEKAYELKAYIQQNNITNRFGLENAVKFHTKDAPSINRIMLACVQHNVLANFLAERKVKSKINKPFIARYSNVLKQQSDLDGEEIKKAMILCLYISNFISKEDIEKRLHKNPQKETPASSPKKKKEATSNQHQIPLPPSVSKDDQEVDEVETIIGFKFNEVNAPDKSSLSPLFPIEKEPKNQEAEEVEETNTLVRTPAPAVERPASKKPVKSPPKAVEKAKPKILKKKATNNDTKQGGGFLKSLFLLLLLPFLYFLYTYAYPYFSNNWLSTPTYCIATGLKIRSEPSDASEHLASVGFGDELNYYREAESAPGWIYVQGAGENGYVKAKYVADKQYARELAAILGDPEALYGTGLTRNRKALKSYFDTKNYCGLMDMAVAQEIYKNEPPVCNERWQIFAKDHTTSLSLRMIGDGTIEYAGLLTNVGDAYQKKLVILSFEGNAENASGFLEMDLPASVEEIALAKTDDKKWNIGAYDTPNKQKLERDGIYFRTTDDAGTTETYLVIWESGDLQLLRQ